MCVSVLVRIRFALGLVLVKCDFDFLCDHCDMYANEYSRSVAVCLRLQGTMAYIAMDRN